MTDPRKEPERHPLADIDQIIHRPARLMALIYLYSVESVEYVFLLRLTGLSWGNRSTRLNKLEEACHVAIQKEFVGKKPHTTASLTAQGRKAFREYKKSLQQALDDLPD